MLAGEGPAGAILHSVGIAVGVQVEITDLPEVSCISCSLERSDNILLTVGTERFKVEVDLDSVVIGLVGFQVEGCHQ